MKTIETLTRRPLLNALLITLLVGLLNLIINILFESYHLVSLNYIVSAGFYGSLLFPAYYVFTFVFFLFCLSYLKSKVKSIIIALLLLYIIFSLPVIDMDTFKFIY